MRRRLVLGICTVALVIASGASVTETHTPIASRWNYNEHLFPIFRDNCGACHREGGIAPMSLVTYQEAYPWAQSIREEVLGLRMPPWQAEDGFGDFSNGHALAAGEMDMILEWSSGGYPQGPRDMQPEAPVASGEWALGEPALELAMPEPFTLDAGTSEVVRYFVLPTSTSADTFLTGADVMPGAGAIVRDVAIYVDATGTARDLDAADANPGSARPTAFPTTPRSRSGRPDSNASCNSGSPARCRPPPTLSLGCTTRRPGLPRVKHSPIRVASACTSPTRLRHRSSQCCSRRPRR